MFSKLSKFLWGTPAPAVAIINTYWPQADTIDKENNVNKAFIAESSNGYNLFNGSNMLVGQYSRRRDAVRGARRRGFVVA